MVMIKRKQTLLLLEMNLFKELIRRACLALMGYSLQIVYDKGLHTIVCKLYMIRVSIQSDQDWVYIC